MTFTVIFAPEAIERLDVIERYIADAGAPVAGSNYVDANNEPRQLAHRLKG